MLPSGSSYGPPLLPGCQSLGTLEGPSSTQSHRCQTPCVRCLARIRGALPRHADAAVFSAEPDNQVLSFAIGPLDSGQCRHDLALPPRVECGTAERPQDEFTLAHGGTHQCAAVLRNVALADDLHL